MTRINISSPAGEKYLTKLLLKQQHLKDENKPPDPYIESKISKLLIQKEDFYKLQAQSRRWLHLHTNGLATAIHRELLTYFKCTTVEEREALPVLTTESEAVVVALEAERQRSRELQGGAAVPNDWFISAEDQHSLVSLMKKTKITEGKVTRKSRRAVAAKSEQSGEGEQPNPPSNLEQTKNKAAGKRQRTRATAERRLARRVNRVQKEIDELGGPSASEAAKIKVRVLEKSQRRIALNEASNSGNVLNRSVQGGKVTKKSRNKAHMTRAQKKQMAQERRQEAQGQDQIDSTQDVDHGVQGGRQAGKQARRQAKIEPLVTKSLRKQAKIKGTRGEQKLLAAEPVQKMDELTNMYDTMELE